MSSKQQGLSRRAWLAGASAVGAAALTPALVGAAKTPLVLGTGKHRYQWVTGWAQLPPNLSFGNTHGCIVTDSQGRVYMNTDTDHAVIVFDRNGKFVKSWGKEFAGGLHGMCVVKEKGREVMYLAHTGRHEVVKSTLDGEVLQAFPFPEKAGVYKDKSEYKPTSVAVAPNGDFYVGDGYGLSWVHQYSAAGEYVRSWGGKGEEPGKMRTPHGVWVDTRSKETVLLVADRGNHRLQIFDLQGKLLDVVGGIFDLPCHVHQRGTDLVVPDLNGRVTILDKDNRLVTHLGENIDPERRGKNKVGQDAWRDGEFIAPHCARWDDRGDLYVMDWNFLGRITKLKRV